MEEEDEALIEKEINCAIDDLPSTMKMFEWSGISFGDAETFRIYKAMKRLAKTSGATHLRFWGKFLGRQRDYFVIEGTLPYSEEAKAAEGAEARGKGVNSHVYWVTDDLLSDWIQLPDSEPKYILAARSIKYVVTGNLNADLNTNPKFPGKERHYLRAQIARITHTTTLAPRDYLKPNDENDREVEANEEFACPAVGDLTNTENWVHEYHHIMNAGIAEHDVSHIGEEEREEALAALEDKDPFVERLKGANDDKQVFPKLEGAWTTKTVGNTQSYQAAEDGTVTYACAEVRSLRWKGAITVSQNGRWANLYIGYGVKTGDVCFNPTKPQDIMDDPTEPNEQPEPTPLEAPPEPQEDAKPEGEGAEGDQEPADE